LADVRADWALQYNELYMFLKREGILGIFPMTEQWVRLISMRPPRDQDAEREPTLAEFQSLVDRYVPEGGRIFDPLWLASFRLHSRGVSEYRVGRVFVAGDAAHIHSPAGGQGMNTGIQDSFNLAWKLAWVIKKSSDPQILESYHAERFPIGQRVLRTTDRMFSMVVSVNPFIRFFRNYIFPPLARRILPRVTRWLTYFVSQLQVNYRNSRWVSEQPGGKILNQGPKAGERAPDGELLDAVTGTRMRLFEIFRSTEHVLLVFDGAQGGFDSNALEQLRIEYSGLFSICLIMPDKDEITLLPKPWSSYLDPTGNTRRAYGAETPCLYLIRPDRYVGFRQALGNLASFRRYLARHFPSQGPVA
jgi:hypothetical protein